MHSVENDVVVYQSETEWKDVSDLHIFDNLGKHNEAVLVECHFTLEFLESDRKSGPLHLVALLHELDDNEVSHVVVGEVDEVLADDFYKHVEIIHVIEVIYVVLDGEAQLFVFPARC